MTDSSPAASCPHCGMSMGSTSMGSTGQHPPTKQPTKSVQPEQGSHCSCGFPCRLYSILKSDAALSIAPVPARGRPSLERQNAGAVIRLAPVEGEVDSGVLIGRDESTIHGLRDHVVRHRGIAPRHAAVVGHSEAGYWLIGLGGQESPSWLDGRSVDSARLLDGGVVQLGPLAWQFHADQRLLAPVAPIGGLDLQVDAEVDGRLAHCRVDIDRGQLTALVGPSGCGKSTLLETIRDGSGLLEPADISGKVFFVPQKDLVHRDLKLGDALQMIGHLYGRSVLPFEIEQALDAVGLPTSAKDKFPSELSGGQLRRFRIACALLSGAGIVILDEPDSGLDHETADEIILLLRGLAVRGATIVAVTHHRHVLDQFDRVIQMRPGDEGGFILSDTEISATQSQISEEARALAGKQADRGADGIGALDQHAKPPVEQSNAADAQSVETAVSESEPIATGVVRRFPVLLRRELKKLLSPRLAGLKFGTIRLPHWLIPLVLVPLLFATAVSLSVPSDPNRDIADGLYGEMTPIARLGFLAVVSVIWMSASQSHLSLTRDRELYDHEQSYGLTWPGVLAAKSVVMVVVGILQTLVFAFLLSLIRDHWLGRSFFVDERWTQPAGVVVCLAAVSCAATLLGVLISTLAGRTPLLATAILPVLMMFQILFSAPFAISKPDRYEPLVDYEQLTVVHASEDEKASDDSWEDDWDSGWEDASQSDGKPLWVTSLVSYATLSRYGDQWIRSCAVTVDPPEHAGEVQKRSLIGLALIAGFSFAVACCVPWLQSTRLGRRRRSALGLILILMTAVVAPPASAQDPSDDGRIEGGDRRVLQALQNVPRDSPRIRVPLVDGRYDENALRAAFGATHRKNEFGATHRNASGATHESTPRWRKFDHQDRLGLVALEIVGKIEFTLSREELVIDLKQTPKWDLMKQLSPPRLLGIEEVGDAEQVILFVHGLEGGAATFKRAAEHLDELGLASLRFDYPNDGPPAEIGKRLSTVLSEFVQSHPRCEIQMVAHSLGGLVATWAVGEVGFPAERVPNVFTLGTPFQGSALASFHDELELVDVALRLATGHPGALNTVSDGRGEAATALRPGSEFLRDLLRRRRPEGIRFHLAAGTRSFLDAERRERLAEMLPSELARLGISPKYALRLDRLLAAEELEQGAGDGAVTVKSALGLPNAASSTTFPLTHTALVSSLQPLEWALGKAGLAEAAKQLAK